MSYAAALLLAAIFASAGAAKLRRADVTERTFRAFGLAAPRTLARTVPLVELGLAAGLVVVPGWAAAAALAVLAAFTTVLVRAMRAGVDVGCGCFGTSRREPVSFVELVRNGLLALAAAVALLADGPQAVGIDAVIAVTTAAAVGGIVLALADLKRATGTVWKVELP
jgi:uncharacterized membrane protein YphA (DoxX/SURF4 family)